MKHLDWVFHDFKLGQIHLDESYARFKDGNFETSGQKIEERCVPLSMRAKRISDTYAYWGDRLHNEGTNGLNFPDIHRWLVSHWLETCLSELDTKEFYEERYGQLRKFCEGILDACRDFKWKEIEGVRLGR